MAQMARRGSMAEEQEDLALRLAAKGKLEDAREFQRLGRMARELERSQAEEQGWERRGAEEARKREAEAAREAAAARAARQGERPESWASLERRAPVDPWKERVTIRIDAEVLKWFKKSGPGYQTRINAVLRDFWEMKRGR